MKGISRRARACAVVAATGAMALTGTAYAQDTFPEKTGDGVPTGQGSIQLYTHRHFIDNGGGLGNTPPALTIAPAANGSSCATATSTECRWNRLDALFGYLAANGLDSVELFGHAALPVNENIDGPYGWNQYRALLDKHGLHAAGWHGSLNESQWPARVAAAKVIGLDYIGTGNGQADGTNLNSYDSILRSAEALNRLGKYSVENGVGPVYVHNHTTEFDRKYVDNGVLKGAWDIMIERTDPRYVAFQVDAFWSSDAFNDATGAATAAFINKYPTRIKLMHVKDGVSVTSQPSPDNSRGGSPRAFGDGEVDYRPIIAAGKGKIQYYHQEDDNGTLTGMVTSLRNLKGRGPNVVPALLGLPTTFPSVAAGTPAAGNIVPVVIQNTGDADLNITNTTLTGENAGDFQVVSSTCGRYPGQPNGTPGVTLPPGNAAAGVARGTCTVNVGFKPTATNKRSVAYLTFTSNADDATERVLLIGQSTADAVITAGGMVDTVLSLNVGSGVSFGAFQPAVARNYDAATAASVVSTAANATLSVSDPTTTAPGHLVNNTFSLPQPLQIRANNTANTGTAYTPLSETTNAATTLLTYDAPTSGADNVTLNFRQAIGATDQLRAGAYSKTLTFTLSTTQP
jgi:sugar phosphate isomerase/epimerase